MGVWDIYYVLFKHKWRILGWTFAIIGALVVFSFCWPPVFRSSARMLLEKTTSTLSDAAIFPQHSTSLMRAVTGNEEANNETQIIMSRPVLEKVVKELNLVEPRPDPDPGGFGPSRVQWALRRTLTFLKDLPRLVLEGLHIIPPAPPARKFAKAVDALKHRLIVQQVADSDVVQIEMEGWFPDQITKEVRAVAAEYLSYHVTVHQQAGAVGFFDDHLADARVALEGLEQELADYRADNGLLSMEKAEATLLEKVEILERERINIRKEMISLRTRLLRVRSMLSNPASPMIPSPEINSLDSVLKIHDELLEKRLALEGMLDRYTPENPQVQAVRADVARVEASLRAEVERVVGLEEAQLMNWEAEDQALGMALGELRDQMKLLPAQRLKVDQLDRAVREATGLYEAILKKRADSQLTLSQDLRMVKVSMIEWPSQPVGQVWPDLIMNLLIGVPLAPVISIALAFLLESLRSTFKREEDIPRFLGVPSLAVMERSGKASAKLAAQSLRRAASVILERAAQSRQRVLVTSAVDQEGAGAVAHGLADEIGTSRRVLLVTGAAGRAPQAQAPLAGEPKPPNGVISVGLPDESRVWTRAEIAQWLEREAVGSEVVIVAAPPVLSSSIGHAMAGACNAAVLVIAAESTGHGLVERARERIRESGLELMGAVLTGYRRWIPASLEQRL